jgi:two-component system cell cycle sensor histidine kinase/response regulator CckA
MVIRQEREKLVDFTDHAPVGFYAMDENGRFTFINATLARWLGSDIDSLLGGGTLHSYLENPPKSANPYDIKVSGGARQVAEVKIKGPAGKIFDASINQWIVIEAEGRVRVRGVVHDLTSEREMTQALKDSEDRFRIFFHESPIGIAMIDPSGVISDTNQMLSDLVNLEPSDIEGHNFIEFVSEADQEKVKSLMSDVRHKKITTDPVDIEMVSNKTGTPKATKIYASPLKGNNVAIRIFDRTEQKNLEEQVNQSQKMQAVGQLAGGVAHDFNNLLTAIIGFCDLLLLRHKPGDPSFGDIQQIKQNSNRASNLVRQLLAFSRQQQLNPKVLDITETLTELSHLVRRLIGVQIELELRHGSNLHNVKVDEGQFEQVMINLAVNARDAMDGKGHLEISTENVTLKKSKSVMNDTIPVGHWVAVHVKDTGCGIDDATLQRIFEPFFTTKKVGEGTGLGLSTVYGIVRQTGGYIDVESKKDKGTTFSVYLPKYVQTDEDAKISEAVEQQKAKDVDLTGTATILLVEDEEPVRMFAARALTNKGYQILEADCGTKALEVMADHDGTIDLVVTDVIMPEMDGPTLAKEIMKDHPDMPIIFVSGYTEDRFKEEIGENAHFLPKPFTLDKLAAKVKEVLTI